MSDDGAAEIDAEGPAPEKPKDAATNDECTLKSEVAGEDAVDSFNPFDEIHESVDLGPLPTVIAADGMPTIGPIDPDFVPPLSPETLVCMGVFDKFVLRGDFGDVVCEFQPEQVERAPNGAYLVEWGDLTDAQRERLSPIRADCNPTFQVEPIRPPCRHYVRKQMPMEEAHDHRYVYRLCSARRTTEGTFMSVGNTAVWACSMREPRDVETEKVLDDFDAQKVKEGRERSYHSIFNIKLDPKAPQAMGQAASDADALIKNAGLGSLGGNKT